MTGESINYVVHAALYTVIIRLLFTFLIEHLVEQKDDI